MVYRLPDSFSLTSFDSSLKREPFGDTSELHLIKPDFKYSTTESVQSRTPSRSDRFNWGRGSPGGLGEEIEIFPGPLA